MRPAHIELDAGVEGRVISYTLHVDGPQF
jgi:hypothetical protein